MRTISGIILSAALFLSSHAGTVTLPSRSWMSFSPLPPNDVSCTVSSNTPSCSSDSTDFYWMYFEGCVCVCLCCPSIAVASKRPFYVSRKPMNFSDYKGDTTKLADTTLFFKCDTSAYPTGISCPVPFSSAALLFGTYGLLPYSADSLRTRLLVFRTRFNYYPSIRYVPLKFDRIDSKSLYCEEPSQNSTIYDGVQVTFGNDLTEAAVPAQYTPSPRSALHITTTGSGYVISGFGEGKASLEIVNAQGKTVYSRPVFSPPAVIGKNVLGPGIYFIRVHSQTGNSSIVLPVH